MGGATTKHAWSIIIALACAACSRDGHAPARSSDAGPDAALDEAGCGAVGCLERGTRERERDLDANGTPDTRLELVPCTADGKATCLRADSLLPAVDKVEWRLGAGALNVAVYNFGIYLLGRHFAGDLEAIAVAYAGVNARPEVVVVDPNGARDAQPVARFGAPPGWTMNDTWFGLVRDDSTRRRYPFLAPGQHYVPRKDGGADWPFLCQFDPTRIAAADAQCGTGFRAARTMFDAAEAAPPADPTNTFRHNGGYLADDDGDGWDDIHLPYLWVLESVSGRTGATLAANVFDVSAQTEPSAPAQFHSGRLYGSFTPFRTSGGDRVLVAAANAVGTFEDVNCNVSRYHALLEPDAASPGKLRISWSHYEGFTKNTFQSPLDPIAPVVTRPGNMMDGCIHRFSDSVYDAGDVAVTVYSRFASDAPASDCKKEQVEEIASGFQQAKMDAWTACAAASFLPTRGVWSVQTRRLSDGTSLGSWSDRYAWGTSTRVMPNGRRVFVMDALSGKVRFDRKGESPGALVIAALRGDASWETIATLPAGRPKTSTFYPFERGVGATWGGVPELVTSDRDGDGLHDVALESGKWIGWSRRANAFVDKP